MEKHQLFHRENVGHHVEVNYDADSDTLTFWAWVVGPRGGIQQSLAFGLTRAEVAELLDKALPFVKA